MQMLDPYANSLLKYGRRAECPLPVVAIGAREGCGGVGYRVGNMEIVPW